MIIGFLISYGIIATASIIHFANNSTPEPSSTSSPIVEKQEKCGSVCRKQ